MKNSEKISFKLNTTLEFETPCVATFEERQQHCCALRLYRGGMDSEVIINGKQPNEVCIRLPDINDNEKALKTLLNAGKTFCSMCQYNASKRTK